VSEPQCPEALYSPTTDIIRRCVLNPREHDWRDWHETESGTQWRHRINESMEGPEWTPPF
jgi:hypothetical protein